jgi:hypothetical protein
MTRSRSVKKKSSLFILLRFLINRSFIPMESSVRGQEREGEDDLILRDLDFPDAAFKADEVVWSTWKVL